MGKGAFCWKKLEYIPKLPKFLKVPSIMTEVVGAIFLGAMALVGQARELNIYGTARSRGKFANEKAVVLLGQVRESWPSMFPQGHVELTKMLWHF